MLNANVYAAIAVVTALGGLFVSLQLAECSHRKRRFFLRPSTPALDDSRRWSWATRLVPIAMVVVTVILLVAGWADAGHPTGWPPRLDFWLSLSICAVLAFFAVLVWFLVERPYPRVRQARPLSEVQSSPRGPRDDGFLLIDNDTVMRAELQWVNFDGELSKDHLVQVRPHQRTGLRTFDGHIWVLRVESDAPGKPLIDVGRYEASSTPVRIQLTN